MIALRGREFTGQDRDQETQLDYFNARYFSAALGRFTSPDPMNAGADLTDPQTWNGYNYVRNNPLALVDPSGMFAQKNPPSPDPCDDDPFCGLPVQRFPDWPGGGGQSQQPPPPTVAEQLLTQAWNWITAPRDPNCVQQAVVAGAAVGAAGGAIAGGIGGGTAGGILGSVVPVARNVAGAAGGGELGAAGGAAVGGGLGYLGGMAAGYLTCASSTGGSGAGQSVGSGGSKGTRVNFGHGARHLTGSGLQQVQVENAIKTQIEEIAGESSSTGSFWGKVVVNGQQIFYRAFTLPDGTINVGTYTVGAP